VNSKNISYLRTFHPYGVNSKNISYLHTFHPCGVNSKNIFNLRTYHPYGVNSKSISYLHTFHPCGVNIKFISNLQTFNSNGVVFFLIHAFSVITAKVLLFASRLVGTGNPFRTSPSPQRPLRICAFHYGLILFGLLANGIASLICSRLHNQLTILSIPSPKPECGTLPYLLRSIYH